MKIVPQLKQKKIITKTLECLKSWKSDTNWYKRKIQTIIESEYPKLFLKTNEILRAMHSEYGKIWIIPTRSCNYSAQRFKWYWRFDGKVQWVKPSQNPAAHTYVRRTEMLSSWVYSLPIVWYRMLFYDLLNSSFLQFRWTHPNIVRDNSLRLGYNIAVQRTARAQRSRWRV